MGEYKTPGVYIKEKNAFGNSVVEAETAIPAFIGYTEITQNGAKKDQPQKISSMTEFVKYFGGAPKLRFDVDIIKYDAKPVVEDNSTKFRDGLKGKPESGIFQYTIELSETEGETKVENGYAFGVNGDNPYTLYYNMILFFANGGATCYVVSVGNNQSSVPDAESLKNGITSLEKISEITMVVVPEAISVADDNIKDVQVAMLAHCGDKMKNRIALLDIQPINEEKTLLEQIETFQTNIGSNYMSFGVAYHPWLNTSVLVERDLNGSLFEYKDSSFFDNYSKFAQVDSNFVNIISSLLYQTVTITEEEKKKTVKGCTLSYEALKENDVLYADKDTEKSKLLGTIKSIKDDTDNKIKNIIILWELNDSEKQELHQALLASSILYKQAIKTILSKLNLLPPSAAMAGIYTMVDNTRGVWKAPANVTLNYVNSVAEDIDDDAQANLNAPMNGKAVNVIRPFRGEGIKVWGARTLDGNSLDWRYVNVRRTLLFLEESVKNAARAYVFEPNDASTWINMKCMIESFLRSVWKRGGLAGATPEDAFEVHVGLGDTMTGEDILEGIMRISVLVAVSHPAEFIEITFQQQMQKS